MFLQPPNKEGESTAKAGQWPYFQNTKLQQQIQKFNAAFGYLSIDRRSIHPSIHRTVHW